MTTRAFRRIHVTAPYGRLIHEIRLSQNEGRWEARVVTLPNHIWVQPGGQRALVFVADTARDAEQAAAAFIERDCAARGHRVDSPSKIDARETTHDPARRRLARYPVRFVPRSAMAPGRQRGSRAATTQNLSETGLFIVTDDPLPPGACLDIDLRLPGLAERLTGVVIWTRMQPAPGCEVGMGVRLVDPPLAYRATIQTFG